MRKPGSWVLFSLWQRTLVLSEAGPARPSLSSGLASTRKAVPFLVSTWRAGLVSALVRVIEISSSTRPGISELLRYQISSPTRHEILMKGGRWDFSSERQIKPIN